MSRSVFIFSPHFHFHSVSAKTFPKKGKVDLFIIILGKQTAEHRTEAFLFVLFYKLTPALQTLSELHCSLVE